jgi:hypothetical protein
MHKRMRCIALWLILAIPSLVAQASAQQRVVKKSNVYGDFVLELTEPVMKGFMNGARLELAQLDEFVKQLGTYKKPEDYARCTATAVTSTEALEIMDMMLSVSDSATQEEIQRVMTTVSERTKALLKERCGPSVVEEWPREKRSTRVDSIVARAAAAAGPVNSPDATPLPLRGPSIRDDLDAGPQGVGMTLKQYGITIERAEQYCLLLKAEVIHPRQPVVHPGKGDEVFWIYSEVEARAIEPLCPEILKARDIRNVMLVQIYWEDSQLRGTPTRCVGPGPCRNEEVGG